MTKIIDRLFERYSESRGYHARLETWAKGRSRLQILLQPSIGADAFMLRTWDGTETPIHESDLADAISTGPPLMPQLIAKMKPPTPAALLEGATRNNTSKVDDLTCGYANMWVVHFLKGKRAGYWLEVVFPTDIQTKHGVVNLQERLGKSVITDAVRARKSPLQAALELHASKIEPALMKVDPELLAVHQQEEIGVVSPLPSPPRGAAAGSAIPAVVRKDKGPRLFKGKE